MRPDSNNGSRACDSYADALVDYSDNELAADQRANVASHLAGCPGCRAQLARLDAALHRLANGVKSTSMATPSTTPSRLGLRWAVAIAAAVLLGLTTAWLITQPPANPHIPNHVVIENSSPPKLTQHDALWQIALIEQQARLQTSLDLLPADALSSDEREQTQTIVQQLHDARISRGDSL